MTHKNSFTVEFKMKVIAYYNEMATPNITHAAKHFGLERDNIKKWIWNRDCLAAKLDEARLDKKLDRFKKMRKITNGRKPFLTSHNEKLICNELEEIRSDGTRVDNDILKKKA